MLSFILACFAFLVLAEPSKYAPWLPMGYAPLVGFSLIGIAYILATIDERRNPCNKPKGTWQDKNGVWRYEKPDDDEGRC